MSALVALLLAATPQLAAPGLVARGVPQTNVDTFNDFFAQQLSLKGVRVVTSAEIATLLGLERQKQLAGCGDESACIAELSGALGVTGLITGSVALLGEEWVVNLKVLSSPGNQVLGLYSARKASEREVLDFLADSAADLAAKLVEPEPARQRSRAFLVPAAAAGAFVVAGAVTAVFSKLAEQQLLSGSGIAMYSDVQSVRGRGEALQSASITLFGVAAAAVVASIIMFVVSDNAARFSAAVLPGGAYGAVGIDWP